jgi:multidrug transporter EmrE-like cation transporter
MKTLLPYFCVLISMLVSSLAQVGIKWNINKSSENKGNLTQLDFFASLISVNNFLLLLAISISFILWVFALKNLQLSHAYALTALSYVIVPTLSMICLSEQITLSFVVGTALIISGILLCLN